MKADVVVDGLVCICLGTGSYTRFKGRVPIGQRIVRLAQHLSIK